MVRASLALLCALAAGCASRDDSAPSDLDAFAAEVRDAVAGAGNRHCARALPFDVVTDGDQAREHVRSFVAAAYDATITDTSVDETPCGTADTIDCAHLFNHHLYKSDGITADALLPAAQRVEAEAADVVVSILTPTVAGSTRGPGVTIAGTRDATLFGIVFFNELAECP